MHKLHSLGIGKLPDPILRAWYYAIAEAENRVWPRETTGGVAVQFHMASMTRNWTTTTQIVKLSAHLLSMLYCCAFISKRRTTDSDACEGRLVCYRFQIVIMRCTTNAVTRTEAICIHADTGTGTQECTTRFVLISLPVYATRKKHLAR